MLKYVCQKCVHIHFKLYTQPHDSAGKLGFGKSNLHTYDEETCDEHGCLLAALRLSVLFHNSQLGSNGFGTYKTSFTLQDSELISSSVHLCIYPTPS